MGWRLGLALAVSCLPSPAAYLNVDTNGNVKAPTNFPKFLLLSGNNFTAEPTNTADGWAIRGHTSGGGGATNWSAGNTSATHWAVVSLGTNNTGAIKTLSVSGSITLTEEGQSNVVIGASAASGEANTASTLGTNGLYRLKSGVDLQFASISGTNGLELSTNANYVRLDPASLTNAPQVTNWINFRQLASANLTNWSSLATSWVSTVGVNETNTALITNWINFRQPATDNLTNWSSLATSWVSAVGMALTNTAQVTNWINFRQLASANLTNWSSLATSWVSTVGVNETNTALITNWINFRQPAAAQLTNLANTADAAGMLTNNSSGTLGWMAIPSGGGGATNWSAGNTSATHWAVVSLGTNNSGAIKTLSVSGSITLTEEGQSNIVIGASAASGEANTASTLGTNGLYRLKSGVDLQFASISGTNGIEVRTNANYVELDGSQIRLVAGLDATNHANAILQSATNHTLLVSNLVRLVAGLEATNHNNGILQSATNYTIAATNLQAIFLGGAYLSNNIASRIAAPTASASTTNVTLLATIAETYIQSSNVNIVAIMQGVSGQAMLKSIVITNGTGVTWGISFSAATNRWKWPYATGAPAVLTNGTQLLINARIDGTNVLGAFAYFSWP